MVFTQLKAGFRIALRVVFAALALAVLALVLPFGARFAPAAPAERAGSALPGFAWPLAPPVSVGRPFERPPGPYAAGHRGVDLVAEPGSAVLSPAAGTVSFAGRVVDRDVVVVAHPGGLRSSLEPVTPGVAVGERVARGSPLGALAAGHPGCPGAACLHWGLRLGAEYLDPTLALSPHRVRLLPGPGP